MQISLKSLKDVIVHVIHIMLIPFREQVNISI